MQQEVEWDKYSIVLTEEDGEIPYESSVYRSGRSFKVGQLKLLVNEILFIVNHWSLNVSPDIYLVVAGSVTGEHFECFAEMFPQIVKIDLWDPKDDLSLLRPGKKKPNAKIEFIQDYLTPEVARERYYSKQNVYFVSDLRTVGYRDVEADWRRRHGISTKVRVDRKMMNRMLTDKAVNITEKQREKIMSIPKDQKTLDINLDHLQINTMSEAQFVTRLTAEQKQQVNEEHQDRLWLDDHTLQEDIVNQMQPRAAMLKFKVPYDIYGDPDKTVMYFDGYIYKQVFASSDTTECRLVPLLWKNGKFDPTYTHYSVPRIEKKFAYYNRFLRDDPIGSKKIWRNPVNRSTEIHDGGRLENSYDTCYLLYVLDRYLWFIGYGEQDKDKRMKYVLGLWNWIIDTIEHYKGGKPFDFDKIRQDTKRFARTDYYAVEKQIVKEKVAVPNTEEILRQLSEAEYEPEMDIPPQDVLLSFQELQFDNFDFEKDLDDLI